MINVEKCYALHTALGSPGWWFFWQIHIWKTERNRRRVHTITKNISKSQFGVPGCGLDFMQTTWFHTTVARVSVDAMNGHASLELDLSIPQALGVTSSPRQGQEGSGTLHWRKSRSNLGCVIMGHLNQTELSQFRAKAIGNYVLEWNNFRQSCAL